VASPFAALPKFHRGALAIVVVTVLLTALIGDRPIATELRLQPEALWAGRGLWQPFTANFVFPEGGGGLVLGTVLVQWFFGSQLESFWGTRRYLVFALGCGTAGYLAYALLSPYIPAVEHGGTSAIDLAVLTAFGVVYGKRTLSLMGAVTMRGRTLAAILVGLGVIAPLLRGAPWPTLVPWLVAIAAALLVTLQPWRRAGDSGKVGRPKSKGKTRAKHLRVVDRDPSMLN